jgi:hypothetical protein
VAGAEPASGVLGWLDEAWGLAGAGLVLLDLHALSDSIAATASAAKGMDLRWNVIFGCSS